MTAHDDIQKINALLDEVTNRAATDGGYRDQFSEDQVGALAAVGATAIGLAQSLVAAGADGDDVAGFGLGPDPFGGPNSALNSYFPDANGIKVNTICVGTCKKNTVEIIIKTGGGR